MSNNTQNRRQFLKTSGKAGMAMATLPIFTKLSPSFTTALSDYVQQPLPYGYAALEPFIDALTMEIHYTKHAAAYSKNLADACVAEKVDTNATSLTDLLKNRLHSWTQ